MKQRISVLCVVREESVMRSLMREMDDGERCTFFITNSAAQALRVCASLAPDVLIVDAILPEFDGPSLVERMRDTLGDGMPRVIGGAMMPFAKEAFVRHGVHQVISVPWIDREVREALAKEMEKADTFVRWDQMEQRCVCADALLAHLGMKRSLRGCSYLSLAAALAAQDETRLRAVRERIYCPVAQRMNTTPQNIERLIRHAIESTMDTVGAGELYAFFGNTIDPARGKPTNAQMIAMLAQRVRAKG